MIGRDESRKFGELERGLFAAAQQLGVETPSVLEAHTDLVQNRLRQLTGSIWLRERALMRRIIGEAGAEQGEIEEAAIGGLTDTEKAAYFDQTTRTSVETDELDYSKVKVRMEAALTADLAGRRLFGVHPDRYEYFLPFYGEGGQTAGMQFEAIDLTLRPATRRTETLHFSEADSPGHNAAADAELNYLEAAQPAQIETVSAINLVAFRSDLSEANRRLDALGALDDLKLRAAVLNGTGLDKIFSTSPEADLTAEFRSWE